MNTGRNDSDEVRRLRRAIGDMEALLALPAMLADLGPENISNRLAKVLLSTLDLDLVYIRLAEPGDPGFAETVRSKHRPDADSCISEARASLASLLTRAGVAWVPVTAVPDPFGTSILRTTITLPNLSEWKSCNHYSSRSMQTASSKAERPAVKNTR